MTEHTESPKQAAAATADIRFPRFEALGEEYPFALQAGYERILASIDQHWDEPDLAEIFADLIIDRRGGREGFPGDVLNDIMRLKQFRESENLRLKQLKAYALMQLEQRGYALNSADFVRAVNNGDRDAVDHFINAEFKFRHIRDTRQSSPLMTALKRGHTVCAHILLRAGDDPNARDNLGLSPLLISCGKPERGFRSITEMLIERGADVAVRDPMGNTPLLLALSGAMWDIALLLIEHGASLGAKNQAGDNARTLLDRHAAPDNPDYQALLEKIAQV